MLLGQRRHSLTLFVVDDGGQRIAHDRSQRAVVVEKDDELLAMQTRTKSRPVFIRVGLMRRVGEADGRVRR